MRDPRDTMHTLLVPSRLQRTVVTKKVLVAPHAADLLDRWAGWRRLDEAERYDRAAAAERERQCRETLDGVARHLGGVG